MSQIPPNETVRSARNSMPMLRWLGYFLLVFAVAGFAFYLVEGPPPGAPPAELSRSK